MNVSRPGPNGADLSAVWRYSGTSGGISGADPAVTGVSVPQAAPCPLPAAITTRRGAFSN